MAFELKPGRGSLFKNKRKTQEQHPDYEGQLNIDGKLYRLGAWLRDGKSGGKWMSISAKPDERATAAPPTPAAAPARSAPPASSTPTAERYEFDDAIPF
jgi:hypothetical protein